MVIVSAGAAYAGMSYYYSDKFFEGTSINGIDCSGKTAYEAEQKIAKTVENYSIEVDSRNLDPQTISGDQIGYSYVSDGSVLKLLKDQKPYEWIRGPQLDLDKEIFTEPLTMVIQKEGVRKMTARQGKKKLAVHKIGDKFIFDFNPFGEAIKVYLK